MANLYEYTDYRKFLSDYLKEARVKNPHFSHRYFAQLAEFTSSGLLANVIKGRRNLTETLIGKFSRALKLNKREEAYFETLVRFNQTKLIDDKNRHYQRMLRLSPLKAVTVSRERYEFYAQWWYGAIRELLNYYRFKDDYPALAGRLDPPVSTEQAKNAITILERLGMIERDSEGFYRQTASVITTGEQSEKSLNIINFQIATIELAKESIRRHHSGIRDISTLTLTFSPESMSKARAEIAALQKKLLAIAEADTAVDSVYQINFQMFPLTKIEMPR